MTDPGGGGRLPLPRLPEAGRQRVSIIAVFPRGAVRFKGTPAMYLGHRESSGAVERHFRGACGSPLFSDSSAMRECGIIAIQAGTLGDVSDLSPRLHYWARSN